MLPSNQAFIDNIQKNFEFIKEYGFDDKPPESFRDETSISYTSPFLMIMFFHSSYNDGYWCVLGKPDKNYPKKPVSLFNLVDELENEPELPKDSTKAIQKTSDLLKNQLNELLNGNLRLLLEIWAKDEAEELAVYVYQKEVALHSEFIGKAEILEIPNTAKALGKSYLQQSPDHDFSNKTTWVVNTDFADFNCNSYEQALEMAMKFK